MRTCGVLSLLMIVLFVAASVAQAAVSYWSVPKVMRAIDGARLHVGTRTVRIDKDTALCAGLGRSIKRDGIRRWRRFACTYTTFTRSGADRDIDFRVRVLGPRRYAIYDAHWVQGIG
jgi:hypothetical protein